LWKESSRTGKEGGSRGTADGPAKTADGIALSDFEEDKDVVGANVMGRGKKGGRKLQSLKRHEKTVHILATGRK